MFRSVTAFRKRDPRKAKNSRKAADGFRKEARHEMCCSILTIIEALKRGKLGLLENIKKLFMGTQAFLAGAIPVARMEG